MTNENVLINLILCGLLGLIGQGIRVIVGLKKLREEASTAGTDTQGAPNAKTAYNDLFDVKKLWLSLFIGFIAGCLAGVVANKTCQIGAGFSREVQLAMVAAGYSGTDFIEGVFKKILPGN